MRAWLAAPTFALALAGYSSFTAAQTTAGTSATIVVPVIAQTASFTSEVTVFNPNAGAITVHPTFYEAQNLPSPGPKACNNLTLGASRSSQFSVATLCALPAGSNFGLLILAEATGTQRFYGYARTQTPQGVGFSTEGFPIENFNDQLQHVTGLKRVAASGGLPANQTNCFVATLGDAVSYELRLLDGATNAQLGGTLSGSLQPFQQFRYLDVFALAGVSAGNKTNVRAQFTNLTGAKKKLIGFCTVQENTTFSADFRIAKSFGGTPQNAFVQGGNAFGTTALLGTTDNQPLNINVNNQRVMRYQPVAPSPNIVGGFVNNDVYAGVYGTTIAGGGAPGTSFLFNDCIFAFGCQNSATDHFGTIGGGIGNLVGDTDGDLTNNMFGTVAGGVSNSALFAAAVGGGYKNQALAAYSAVGGGQGNSTGSGGGWSTVGGGAGNVAGDFYTTVAGGTANTASAQAGTVGGGASNFAIGPYSTVPGGAVNTAGGAYSFASGHSAWARFDGCTVFSDASTANLTTCGATNEFIARALGGVYFFTSGNSDATYHGAYLGPGSSSWAVYSDRAGKDNVRVVEPRDVLNRLLAVPIATWNWKAQDASIRHMGPMAQDFWSVFSLGDTSTSITTVDADGVALAAIQGLHQLVQERNGHIAALERRVAEVESLRGELAALKSALAEVLQEKRVTARRD